MRTPFRIIPLPAAPTAARKAARMATVMAALITAAGCAAPPPPPPAGVSEITERPAERALLAALRAYDDADYPAVERQAAQALGLGLQSRRDRGLAHKLRAFVACTSDRLPACEAEFRAARTEDPAFVLTRAEAGHPIWGPVYQRSRQ